MSSPALSFVLLLMLGACADSTPPTGPRTQPPPDQGVPPSIPPAPSGPVPTGPDYIYVSNADGSAAVRLVQGDRPAWSPDSKRIAFQDSTGISVMNADGSARVHLTAGRWPAWSPDGTQIVFTNSDGIAVMNADGTGSKTLIGHHFRTDTDPTTDMGVGKPAWSPDGSKIAFEHLGDDAFLPATIFIMNSNGSNPHALTSDPRGVSYAESDPAWSPDGLRISFWSYGYGLASVGPEGGVPTSIYKDFPRVAYGTKPSWSPDGRTIAFSYDRLSSDPSIWTLLAQGGGLREIIEHGFDAVWSPDGTHLAYVRK